MALQTATNPQTGESVALVGNEWVPITQTATNPKTGAKAYLVNNQWVIDEPTKNIASPVEPLTQLASPAQPAPKAKAKPEPSTSTTDEFSAFMPAISGEPAYRSVMEGAYFTQKEKEEEIKKRLGLGAGPISTSTVQKAADVRAGRALPTEPVVAKAAAALQEQQAPSLDEMLYKQEATDREEQVRQELELKDRRKFAEDYPILASAKSGAASNIVGLLNAKNVLADGFNVTFVNPLLEGLGLDPLPSTGKAFGTEYFDKAARDYTPKIAKKELSEAWEESQFTPWLISKLASNSIPMAQSLLAAFSPPLRAVLLPSMGLQTAGSSYAEGDDPRVAIAKGLVEVGTEMLPLKAFDKITDTLKGMSVAKQNAVMAVAGKRLVQAGGAITTNALINAIEETAAQLGGNVLDKYFQGKQIELDKGLAEAAVVGAVSGKVMSIPHVAGIATGAYEPNIQAQRLLRDVLEGGEFTKEGIQAEIAETLRAAPTTSRKISPVATTVAAAEAEAERLKQKPTTPVDLEVFGTAADLERKEPELKTEVTPKGRKEPTLEGEPTLSSDEQIEAITQQLMQTRGMAEEDARSIATRRVSALEAQSAKDADEAETERRAKLQAGLQIPDDDPRVQELAGELLDNNVATSKTQAINLAKTLIAEQEAADAASGEGDVGPPDTDRGEGISIPSGPDGGISTAGAEPPVAGGVEGAELPTEPTVRGEGPPSDTVEPTTVTLYRGVQAGKEAEPTVGGGLFMSPDRKVAETYAGKDGNVKEEEVTFTNLLDTPTWTDAKTSLGLSKDKTMADVVNAARDQGYDGVTFTTTNGREYIVIPQKETPSATTPTETVETKEEGAATPVEGTEVAEPATETEPSKTAILSGAPVNEKLSTARNASQGLAVVASTGDEVQRTIANRLRASTTNVPIVVVEKDDPIPAQIADNKVLSDNWDVATAMYVGPSFGQPTIYLRGASFGERQSVNNVDVLHEAAHAAIDRKITTAENMLETRGVISGVSQDPLVQAYAELRETMDLAKKAFDAAVEAGDVDSSVLDIGEGFDVFNNAKEFVAYGISNPAFVNFLKSVKTPGKFKSTGRDKSLFTKFVESIRKLLGLSPKEFNALVDLLDVTDRLAKTKVTPFRAGAAKVGRAIKQKLGKDVEDVSLTKKPLTPEEKEAAKEQKTIDTRVDEAIEKLAKSRSAEELAKQSSVLYKLRNGEGVLDSLRDLWKSGNYKSRSALVNLVTTDALVQWAEDGVPRLVEVNKQLQAMSGMSQKLMGAAADLSRDINNAFSKNPQLRRKLEDITKIATLSQIDPAVDQRSVKLNDMYKALGAEGQKIYKDIKAYYDDMADLYTSLLDAQINQANISDEAKEKLLASIKKMYETDERLNPYFPLTRDGNFWLAVYTGKRGEKEFYMFPTMAERDEVAKQFAEQRNEELDSLLDAKTFEIGNDVRTMRMASSEPSALLKSSFQIIDNANFTDENVREEMKDAVYQLYLRTMPEQSFRKQFITRKGYAGFRTDLLRDFNESSLKMSLQLARLKYAPLIRNSLSAARNSINNQPDYEPFVAEMEKRVADSLNPRIPNAADKVAAVVNRFSFIHYLSGASSALLQPIGIFQTGVPILGARHGYPETAAELAKLMKIWDSLAITRKTATGDTVLVMPSIVNSSAVNASPEERKAVEAMLARDVTQSTYARALYEYNNIPSEKINSPTEKFKRGVNFALGGLMHSTERLSREVLFLTSYRLSRRKDMSEEDAIEQAIQDTNDALGNYGEYNRPMVMRNPGGKIALQFQMYPLHVTLYLLKNFKRMFASANKKEKAEAAKIFFGTLGTTFILSGAAGLPMFSAVMGLIGWAWGAMDDDEKPKDAKDLDFILWFRTVFLPEQLGHVTIGGEKVSDIVDRGLLNAFTGLDFASRTQLNDMWFRDLKETRTAREELTQYAIEKAGPGVNMVLSWADAYEAFKNGDYQKGVEKISPALIRNLVLTHKYATEGAKDNKGAQILSKDAFTTGELIGQAIGFRSDLLANTQNVTFKIIGIQQKIENERQKLFDNIDREYRNRNFKAYNNLLTKDVVAFNKKYPTFAIEIDDLQNSLERRAKQRGESWRGLRLDEKNAALFAPVAKGSREAVAARERKAKMDLEVSGTAEKKIPAEGRD
jgi:hypothetical protein